jgi:hypothetical protein
MRPALIAAALLVLASTAQAQAQPGPQPQPAQSRPVPHDACFDISQRETLIALNDHSFVVRANGQVYEVTTNRCPGLGRPDPRISVITEGSSFVCGRLDYRLRVGEEGVPGSSLPCIVQSQRRLTPAEVAALPKDKQP